MRAWLRRDAMSKPLFISDGQMSGLNAGRPRYVPQTYTGGFPDYYVRPLSWVESQEMHRDSHAQDGRQPPDVSKDTA